MKNKDYNLRPKHEREKINIQILIQIQITKHYYEKKFKKTKAMTRTQRDGHQAI